MEVVKAVEEASGRTVPIKIAPRRAGDIAVCLADPSKANAVMLWHASQSIQEQTKSAWKWQSQNPKGYKV
jgi:UDP-glucose 4-epimerase